MINPILHETGKKTEWNFNDLKDISESKKFCFQQTDVWIKEHTLREKLQFDHFIQKLNFQLENILFQTDNICV